MWQLNFYKKDFVDVFLTVIYLCFKRFNKYSTLITNTDLFTCIS